MTNLAKIIDDVCLLRFFVGWNVEDFCFFRDINLNHFLEYLIAIAQFNLECRPASLSKTRKCITMKDVYTRKAKLTFSHFS